MIEPWLRTTGVGGVSTACNNPCEKPNHMQLRKMRAGEAFHYGQRVTVRTGRRAGGGRATDGLGEPASKLNHRPCFACKCLRAGMATGAFGELPTGPRSS